MYATALLLGAGLLLPWNVYLNTIPWMLSLQLSAGSVAISFAVPVAYNALQLPTQLAMVRWGPLISPNTRILTCFILQAALLGATPFLAVDGGRSSGALVLGAALLSGLATATLESSIFGYWCTSSSHTQGVLAGEAASAIVANVVQLLLLVVPADRDTVAKAYFAVAASYMLLCAVAFIQVARWEPTEPRSDGYKQLSGHDGPPDLMADAIASVNQVRLAAEVPAVQGMEPLQLDMGGVAVPQGGRVNGLRKIMRIISHTWPANVTIFATCMVSFVVFPGVVTEINCGDCFHSPALAADSAYFTLLLILVCNVADLIGRVLAAYVKIENMTVLLVYAAARVAFVPLLFGCARGWFPLDTTTNLVALAAVGGLGLTAGHLCTLAMMLPAKLTPDPADHEAAGFISVLHLVAGLLVGSQVAVALQ